MRCPREDHQPPRQINHRLPVVQCQGTNGTFRAAAVFGTRFAGQYSTLPRITPTKLAKSYADAGYFARNIRAVEVLIDQDAVRSGTAATEPWKFYDLGHGYCTYDFFDQCPYRMACARCDFYLPKESSRAQMLEARENLLRLRQEIPLTDDELAAVQDGVTAYENLLTKLIDLPTPAGPSLRKINCNGLVQVSTPADQEVPPQNAEKTKPRM